MSSLFRRSPLGINNIIPLRFVRVPSRTTKHGPNVHRSNKAKEGLYHGKDIMSGNYISFSHKKTKRKWYPNVINKKVWSEALNDWVRFRMTTAALRGIDTEGGIDNYLLGLDEPSVRDSNYITKIRRLVGQALYMKGNLNDKMIKRLGFDVNPPQSMPEKSEYCRERQKLPPIEERTEEHLRIRKMKKGWKVPRYY
mmetsp:Transcript_21644/g.31502  ORF Transcript_21644/g.31502 Transcript_21644/m.31502 type:complete len:196 (+) Transcript_21644:56-643(+)